jgi:hypothetical protein
MMNNQRCTISHEKWEIVEYLSLNQFFNEDNYYGGLGLHPPVSWCAEPRNTSLVSGIPVWPQYSAGVVPRITEPGYATPRKSARVGVPLFSPTPQPRSCIVHGGFKIWSSLAHPRYLPHVLTYDGKWQGWYKALLCQVGQKKNFV